MRTRKIFLARHAKPVSQDNERRFLGQTDPPLSPEGILQAEHLANELSKYDISAVYSSDLLRASQTASIIAEKFQISVKAEKRLREIHMGDWDNLAFTEVRSRFPDEFEKRGRDITHYRRPGGESFTDVQKRALPAFKKIALNSTGDVVIVAHAGVNRTILCDIRSVPLKELFSIEIDPASAFELLINDHIITFTGNLINASSSGNNIKS
ncbi:MAG: histidine phosphatase family protein [Spirochaetes bacterium]|nr:histidine phosphatase family protein [Spirochaetota bacterium]